MKKQSTDTNKAPSGVYTCQTCEALFTCLDYYQQHRRDHALQAEGVKLYTCAHCTYVSDNNFHYNWHIMSHASESPHRCDVCASLTDDTADDVGHGGFNGSGGASGGHGEHGAHSGSDTAATGRISDTCIGFGKRSIATHTDDIDYPSSPPPPYQQHSTKSSVRCAAGNLYDNLETIDPRELLDNDEQQAQNVQSSNGIPAEEDDETEEEEDVDAQNEEGEDEEEEEEEEEQGEEQEETYQECDNQQQQLDYYQQQQLQDDETDEEDNNDQSQGNEQQQSYQQQQQYLSYQQQEQLMQQNGGEEYQQGEMAVDDEDDGTIEDEEAQEFMQQEDDQEYHQSLQQQDYLNGNGAGGDLLMDQEFQDEEEEDGHDYDAPVEEGEDDDDDDDEEEEEEENENDVQLVPEEDDLTRNNNKSADVYDFNSDDDGGGVGVGGGSTQQTVLTNGLGVGSVSGGNDFRTITGLPSMQTAPQVQPPHGQLATSGTGTTIQLQPTFVHHQTHHAHPHHQTQSQAQMQTHHTAQAQPHPQQHPQQQQQHPHQQQQQQHLQQQQHQSGLPTLQPHPQQPHPTALTPSAWATHLTNAHHPQTHAHQHHHPHHHHHPQPQHFIISNAQGPGQFGAAQVTNSTTFQLDPATFANGQTIRVLSIPAFSAQPQQSAQQQQQQQQQPPTPTAQPQLTLAPQPTGQLAPNVITTATVAAPTPAKSNKRSKKAAGGQSNQLELVDLNGLVSGTTGLVDGGQSGGAGVETLLQPPYVPTKGKGKGNRKPRINFVSVVNGVTVGADGVRRKFHCSHCGNGKSFKTKSHLQRHMLTHTGEKPYQCNDCGAKFNQSSSLRNHMIALHTKQFPHVCTVCKKGFLMPAVLQKHIQQTGHHSEDGGTGGLLVDDHSATGGMALAFDDDQSDEMAMAVGGEAGLKLEAVDDHDSDKMYVFSSNS